MTVTYQLSESEFDYQLFKRIKSQFGRRNNSFKIKIEVETAETDETAAIMANPYLVAKLNEGIEAVKNENMITFNPEQFNELLKEHSIHATGI